MTWMSNAAGAGAGRRGGGIKRYARGGYRAAVRAVFPPVDRSVELEIERLRGLQVERLREIESQVEESIRSLTVSSEGARLAEQLWTTIAHVPTEGAERVVGMFEETIDAAASAGPVPEIPAPASSRRAGTRARELSTTDKEALAKLHQLVNSATDSGADREAERLAARRAQNLRIIDLLKT